MHDLATVTGLIVLLAFAGLPLFPRACRTPRDTENIGTERKERS